MSMEEWLSMRWAGERQPLRSARRSFSNSALWLILLFSFSRISFAWRSRSLTPAPTKQCREYYFTLSCLTSHTQSESARKIRPTLGARDRQKKIARKIPANANDANWQTQIFARALTNCMQTTFVWMSGEEKSDANMRATSKITFSDFDAIAVACRRYIDEDVHSY